jgi:4-amino-4-deoxy-L-arabinose transferase-like glycosyltransferase
VLHQSVTLPAGQAQTKSVRHSGWGLSAFLIFCALFLYWDAARSPIALWDESRNIVNALEMRRTGLSLVTTYNFVPDLWNTKPPLLIWLIYGSVELFGANVWALRLPSMLASLATILISFRFARRITGSSASGYIAGTILLLSPCFFANHGARTADYDALLVFFTTAYLFLLYPLIAQPRPRPFAAGLAGLLIAAAVLTKSTSGIIPLAGVGFYLLVTARISRVVFSRTHWLIVLCAIVPIGCFYAAREIVSAGYLAAANYNDLIGRFNAPVVGRETAVSYYLSNMLIGWFALGPLLLALPFGWKLAGPKVRAITRYCGLVTALPLAVLSLSSTKLPHYMLAFYPLLAVTSAVLIPLTYERVMQLRWRPLALFLQAMALATLVFLGTLIVGWRYVALPAMQARGSNYGTLFAELQRRGIGRVAILDEGFTLTYPPHFQVRTEPNYNPVLRSYQLLWAERGLVATRGGSARVIASCDEAVVPKLGGKQVVRVSGCLAVRRDWPAAESVGRATSGAAVRP